MSETPRTDAAIETVDVSFLGFDGVSSSPEHYVNPEFARQLERELVAEQQKNLDHAEDWAFCGLDPASKTAQGLVLRNENRKLKQQVAALKRDIDNATKGQWSAWEIERAEIVAENTRLKLFEAEDKARLDWLDDNTCIDRIHENTAVWEVFLPKGYPDIRPAIDAERAKTITS